MLFSIIIPIYNVEAHLKKCVDSACNQTYKDIEIILVDDGSPDNCPTICDEYAKKDSRIKVVHKTNGGLSDARNAGLTVACGDYVIYLDSDDYIELDACEQFAAYAQKDYDVLIGDAVVEGAVCDLSHIDLEEVVDGPTYYKMALRARKSPVVAWINAYRRKFLLENDLTFKVGILHEDVEFTPRMWMFASSVVYTRIVFYHYIIRANSITTKKDKRKNVSHLINICHEHEERYKNIEDEELRRLILDSLVKGYLSLFQEARAYRYGKEYIQKDFCLRNSYEKKTIYKSRLFSVSPRLYWHINNMLKKL